MAQEKTGIALKQSISIQLEMFSTLLEGKKEPEELKKISSKMSENLRKLIETFIEHEETHEELREVEMSALRLLSLSIGLHSVSGISKFHINEALSNIGTLCPQKFDNVSDVVFNYNLSDNDERTVIHGLYGYLKDEIYNNNTTPLLLELSDGKEVKIYSIEFGNANFEVIN